jgi:hypothetical protein
MPIYNVYELMNFLADSLNDEDSSKFVTLTINNREFKHYCSSKTYFNSKKIM